MKLEKFRNHIEDLVEDLQLEVFLSTLSKFNSRKDFGDRELLIEPFPLPLWDDDSCEIGVNVSFNIVIRREIDLEFTNKKGDDAQFIDFMVELSRKVFKSIESSEYIVVKEIMNNIQTQYWEADSNRGTMSQSFLRFTIPLKIFNLR